MDFGINLPQITKHNCTQLELNASKELALVNWILSNRVEKKKKGRHLCLQKLLQIRIYPIHEDCQGRMYHALYFEFISKH